MSDADSDWTVPAETDDDVLVVGGGLGGYAAALAAAQRANASVRLLLTEEDRFASESGLIDLLGAVPGVTEPVTNPLSAIDQLPEEHRYRQVGLDRVRDALERFDDATGELYAGADDERNALLPTCVGRLVPAARYPAGMANGLATDDRSIRLVGFDRIPDFTASLAANRLAETLTHPVEYSTVKTPYKVETPPIPRKIARALDRNQTNDEGTTTRESLANTLRPVLDLEPRVGVPAVLGTDNAESVRADLESQLQAALFEVPLGPPSVPGRRLESALSTALSAADVTIERGARVTATQVDDGTVEAVMVERELRDNTLTREASAFVLATGGVAAGGIEYDRGGPRESLFDCDVSGLDSGAVDDRFLGDHEAVRAGVAVDEALRPFPAEGDTAFENLYAAGRVLATTNVVAEGSAGGVALATGEAAGRHAGE